MLDKPLGKTAAETKLSVPPAPTATACPAPMMAEESEVETPMLPVLTVKNTEGMGTWANCKGADTQEPSPRPKGTSPKAANWTAPADHEAVAGAGTTAAPKSVPRMPAVAVGVDKENLPGLRAPKAPVMERSVPTNRFRMMLSLAGSALL